jgi:hypothetical protein
MHIRLFEFAVFPRDFDARAAIEAKAVVPQAQPESSEALALYTQQPSLQRLPDATIDAGVVRSAQPSLAPASMEDIMRQVRGSSSAVQVNPPTLPGSTEISVEHR